MKSMCGIQNWDKYSKVLTLRELLGIFGNFHAIPGHEGKLPQYAVFIQYENQLMFIDNFHHAP